MPAINPHLSDQLATATRDSHHRDGCIIPDTVPQLITRLRGRLPGIDPALLGEIVLHTADAAGAMAEAMARRGYRAEDIAPNVALALAEAGGKLYRGQAGD